MPKKAANAKKNSRGLSKADLNKIKVMLIERRNMLEGDVGQMEANVFGGKDGTGGEISHIPTHMADLGSDSYEQEFTLGLIESEEEELREVNAALARIDNGTYGICEECNKKIPKDRLLAVVNARYCITCQSDMEEMSSWGGGLAGEG